MLTQQPNSSPKRHGRSVLGMLEADMIVALAILGIAILPLGYSFTRERKALRVEYYRSVAMEIVDGEMEILAAGDGKNYSDGPQNYNVHARSAVRLPPGNFKLTKTGFHLRLEWNAETNAGVGTVIREGSFK